MPASTALVNLNSSNIAELQALKIQGLSDESIRKLTTFRNSGGVFKSRAELELLGIPKTEVDQLVRVTEIKSPARPSKSVVITTTPPNLAGFRLLYTGRAKDGNYAAVQSAVEIDLDGEARVIYPGELAGGSFVISARAPDGSIAQLQRNGVKARQFDLNEADLAVYPLEITVPSQITATTKLLMPPPTIKGRVLAQDTKLELAELPVLILAATKNSPAEADFFVIAAAECNARGYFTTPPVQLSADQAQNLKAAVALVAGRRLSVRLTPGASGMELLPQRLILFLESKDAVVSAAEADCGCGELNFLKKKVLDEASFHSLVRTTEPAIEALTLEEVAEIDLSTLVPPGDPNFKKLEGLVLPKHMLAEVMDRTSVNSPQFFDQIVARARAHGVKKAVQPASAAATVKGRVKLGSGSSVDWDETPTIYQAIEVSHGHLLHFKQEWFSDGYSIGDLLYSLPLAPGQKKQIVVFDWDRRESASQTQQLDYQDQLYGSLSRDRDVNEVMRSTLKERTEGESHSDTSGWGAGIGAGIIIPEPVPIGAVAGVAGGSGWSNADSWQESSRKVSARSAQHINDRTVQSANSVRSERSTVVQTVAQGERFETSSEVVANYNHCHAITVQYFQVIRHFEIRTRLSSVQECLFVPLRIQPFTRKKALRWRGTLQRVLRAPALRGAFDALERIDEEYESNTENYYDRIGFPKETFAEGLVQNMEGELMVEFRFTRPPDDAAGEFVSGNWNHLNPFVGVGFYDTHIKNAAKRDEAFVTHAGKLIADAVLEQLEFKAVLGDRSIDIPFDTTLLSAFRHREPLRVSLRLNAALPSLRRQSFDTIEIHVKDSSSVTANANLVKLFEQNLRLVIHRATLKCRSQHLDEFLAQNARISNDLRMDDPVRIYTPLSAQAMRNPRAEDAALHDSLLKHLNENLEFYHQHIWWRMDAQRRYMLLDGISVPGRGLNRSAASLVENKLIGIVGNSLVFPVSAGNRLDPSLSETIDLNALYASEPPDPIHLSLPTKGVYAEAVMGQCNSCERKEDDRYWRWEDSPIPDSPTAINAVTPPNPQASPVNLEPKGFSSPIINLQNAPSLPDPQGTSALLTLLGQSNLFRDAAGLTETQRNAAAAFQGSLKSAEFFGGQAANLTNTATTLFDNKAKREHEERAAQNRAAEAAAAETAKRDAALEQIRKARAQNLITAEEANQLTSQVLTASAAPQETAVTAGKLQAIQQLGDIMKNENEDPETKKAAASARTRLLNGIGTTLPTPAKEQVDNAQQLMEDAGITKMTLVNENGTLTAERTAPGGDVQSAGFWDLGTDDLPANVDDWRSIFLHTVPGSIRAQLDARDMEVQDFQFASEPVEFFTSATNLDYFPVRITQMPKRADGTVMTGPELLKSWRENFNTILDVTQNLSSNPYAKGFISPREATHEDPSLFAATVKLGFRYFSHAKFGPQESDDATCWASNDPLGAVMRFDTAPDDMMVVATASQPDHWIFTTVRDKDLGRIPFLGTAGTHPVTGHRQFGFTENADGTLTFFTRAADRSTGKAEAFLSYVVFLGGRLLWLSMQTGLRKFVIDHGGAAVIEEPFSDRFEYGALLKRFVGTMI